MSTDGYPLDSIKTIAEDCKTAFMVFSSAKKGVFEKSHFPFGDQALHEHPQFKVVASMPAKAMELRLEAYEMEGKPDLYLLAARCFDGATCNRLAAMYKGVVPSTNPQLVCAERISGTQGAGRTFVLSDKFTDDLRTKCARLSVCRHKLDRDLKEDVGVECVKAPHKFKLDCYKKDDCKEVVSCATAD